MAVQGELGGQPITLNNAAEEATLQKILDLMQDGNTKFDDADNKVKKFSDEVKKTTKTTQKVEGSFDALERASKNTRSGLEKFSAGALSHSKTIARSFKGLASGADGFIDTFQNVLTSVGDALGKIPFGIGAFLKGVTAATAAGFGFLMGAAQKTTDAFTALADTGATFGNSMIAMRDAAHSAGVPLEIFAKAVSSNVSGLTRFAGSASAGARALSDAQRAIKSQNLDRSLMMMGIALKDQPEYMAQFLDDMSGLGIRASSFSGRMDDLARMAVDYRKEMQIAKQLTGESNEEQRARMKALQKDAQLQAKLRGMTEEERVGFANLMKTVPASLQPAVKDLMLFGTVTKENAGLQAMFPQQLEAIIASLSAGADAGGEYQRQLESRADVLAQEEQAARQSIIISGLSSSDALKQVAGAYIDIARQVDILRSDGIKKIVEEIDKAATGVGADKLTDNMLAFQIAVQDLTVAAETIATKFLEGKGFIYVIGKIVDGLQYLADQLGEKEATPEQKEQAREQLKEQSAAVDTAAKDAAASQHGTNFLGMKHAGTRDLENRLQSKINQLNREIQGSLLGKDSPEIKEQEDKLRGYQKQLEDMEKPTARQYGGPVIPGKRYIVGESGPELFEPDEAGEIQNNNIVRSRMSPQGSTTGVNEALMEHLKRSNELMERLVDINKRGFDDEATMLQRIAAN